MTRNDDSIVQQAMAHFKAGDYAQAKTCYQQAADRYGAHLFAKNVQLCELRLGKTQVAAVVHSPEAVQLTQTQALLEHYYTRCQELEYQLIDKR